MCPRETTLLVDDPSHPLESKVKALHPLDSIDSPESEHFDNGNGNLSENADLEVGLRSARKHIPVRFLYDDLGSELYEQITELEEYYPYMEEKNLLRVHADAIVSHLSVGAIVVELGCGDGSKTCLLLDALARRDGPDAVHFVGIDVSGGALRQAERNLQTLCPHIPPANLEFIEAEYFPGLVEVQKRHPGALLCMLWLGSSVGNFTFPEAAAFLRQLNENAGGGAALLLCTDLWKDPAVLHTAYDDPKGVTRNFILNGMAHALRSLGHPDAGHAMDTFDYDCVVNQDLRQVEMWIQAKADVDQVLPGVDITQGERIMMEISRKFTPEDISGLALNAGLCLQATWASSKYSIQLLLPPTEALTRCWADTDALFAHFPDWNAQPIGLRHPFTFYYGHVAAFSRLKLVQNRKSSGMDEMLSRGIDPLVLDPSKCHSHPDIPQEWPSLLELKAYVEEARSEVLAAAGKAHDASLQEMHALVMVLEHERMHQETLCYMAAQQRKKEWSEKTTTSESESSLQKRTNGEASIDSENLPSTTSSSLSPTPWPSPFYFNRCGYLASAPNNGGHHNSTLPPKGPSKMVVVPGGYVSLGIDPSENHGFVWDNELGISGPWKVRDLQVASQPVTVTEFREFVIFDRGYENPNLWNKADFSHFTATQHTMPSTWSMDATGEIHVHMPEGSFHWKKVAQCPVYCSLAEATAYCQLHGGRVMTEPELVHIGYTAAGASGNVSDLNSGGWEWTSTPLEPFQGFKPDPLYPEYSTDFFDGCHFVLRGSSPYTHPSMCRRSFRNYYQEQYPHMFAKFRIVKDLE